MFYLRNPYVQMQFRGIHDALEPNLQDILNKRQPFSNANGNFLID